MNIYYSENLHYEDQATLFCPKTLQNTESHLKTLGLMIKLIFYYKYCNGKVVSVQCWFA